MTNGKSADSKPTPSTGQPEGGSEAEVNSKELYILTRPYWDGHRMHKRGDKLRFAEGEGPKSKVKAEDHVPKEVDPKRPQTTAGNEQGKK